MKTLSTAPHISQADRIMAKKSSLLFKKMKFGKTNATGMKINGETVPFPKAAYRLFMGALDNIAKGQPVAVVSLDEEVSTQEAAELLNVSRPYVAKLFDEGAIPSRKVGTHRRALTSDVLAYKQREKEARLKVLDELAAEGQRLNLGE